MNFSELVEQNKAILRKHNQKNDVIDFLRRGSIRHKVMALLDGPYWDIHRKDLIKIFLDNPNVIIHSIDTFLEDRNVRHM